MMHPFFRRRDHSRNLQPMRRTDANPTLQSRVTLPEQPADVVAVIVSISPAGVGMTFLFLPSSTGPVWRETEDRGEPVPGIRPVPDLQ